MSHIPNSAMPHAGPTTTADTETNGTASRLFSQFTDTIREHPKTAIAAGAAVAAGVAGVAAATAYSRRGSASRGKSGKSRKST
jgi:hypothetical protein